MTTATPSYVHCCGAGLSAALPGGRWPKAAAGSVGDGGARKGVGPEPGGWVSLQRNPALW